MYTPVVIIAMDVEVGLFISQASQHSVASTDHKHHFRFSSSVQSRGVRGDTRIKLRGQGRRTFPSRTRRAAAKRLSRKVAKDRARTANKKWVRRSLRRTPGERLRLRGETTLTFTNRCARCSRKITPAQRKDFRMRCIDFQANHASNPTCPC